MTQEQRTILLDVDGPLAGFDERGWHAIECHKWETDVPSWGKQVHRYFTDHLTDTRQRKAARRMTEGEGWFRDLPVVPGAKAGVDELLRQGFDVWLCTKPMAANPYCADEKRAWVREHFPELKGKLIITPDNAMVRGDILLDDAVAIDWLPRASWAPVIFTQPFNGEGSHWEHLPHWTWTDQIDAFIELINNRTN